MFAPSLYVIDLPYLFRTNQEGWAILDKYWDELNAKTIKESGNRIIGWPSSTVSMLQPSL